MLRESANQEIQLREVDLIGGDGSMGEVRSRAKLANTNVAVIGCGYWGKNLVRNFAQLRVLRWICDTNETTLESQAQLHPEVRLTSRFEDVLGDGDVQAVVIATSAALHYVQAKEVILSGKDVFVEKPLALRYHEGQELVELAETHSAILMVGHILEYHPAVTLLKDIVRQGELGRVWYIYSNRLNLGKVRQEENILWSFAPHDISVISRLVGSELSVVSAFGGSYLQSGIVDVTVTNLLFDDGVKAHIFVSWLHPYKEQKLVVIGDRKMAVFDDTAREGKLKIYDKGIQWRAGLPVPRQTAETTLFFEETEPMRLECQHFLTCIRERKRPLTDGESALKVLKVLEAGQISLERGGVPVSLAEVESETVV
jgi:UDP-2-acetamido-3-amino-2,3-dideoxy-glucuronate N-acetyltransferase